MCLALNLAPMSYHFRFEMFDWGLGMTDYIAGLEHWHTVAFLGEIMSKTGFCACSKTNTAVFNWMKYR